MNNQNTNLPQKDINEEHVTLKPNTKYRIKVFGEEMRRIGEPIKLKFIYNNFLIDESIESSNT